MKRYSTVSLTGINSNDIYSLHYPDSLLKFCSFDFSGFIKRTTDFCKRCEAAGEYRLEDAVALRNSISSCHKFYEANTHGIYEKIILDFFVEYLCRERGVGTNTLWNNFINSKNRFERMVFSRLTEYRHNKAVNEWVNLLKIQEYAKRKLEFVFGEKAEHNVACAKRDYFDLTFTIAANELGYDMNSFASTRLYSVGRLPSSPFIVNSIAKEISKTALSDMEYPEEEKGKFPTFKSDSEAMDVFFSIKDLMPEQPDAVVKTIVNTMRSMPKKVYVAESFKAVIDLEIDLILENNWVLCRCDRCGEYYIKSNEYKEDYCYNLQKNGKTCLEIATVAPSRSMEEIEELDAMTTELYAYMSKRINVDLTQREFAEWYQYFMAIKENVAHRRLSIAEFKDFEKYSKELKFSSSVKKEKPAEPQPAKEKEEKTSEPKVKPFVFERIDRSELYRQENLRRQREIQATEALPVETPSKPSISDIAQEPPRTTVKVMKAEDTGAVDVTMFTNPFDSAFDEGITELEEEVKSKKLKPLDDIFKFDDFSTEKSDISEKGKSEALIHPSVTPVAAAAPTSPTAEELHFDKAMERASSARKNGTTRAVYAAGMYKKSVQQGDETLFPDVVDDGAPQMTDDDFDILPSAEGYFERKDEPAVPVPQPESELEGIRREVTRKAAATRPSTVKTPKIVLGEPVADDPAPTGNKTKRVLDGLFTPTKTKNPFITDMDDEENN